MREPYDDAEQPYAHIYRLLSIFAILLDPRQWDELHEDDVNRDDGPVKDCQELIIWRDL